MDKVHIDKVNLSEGNYTRHNGNLKYEWSVSMLIQHCKEEKYKSFKLPLLGIDTGVNVWDVKDISNFIEHVKRVDNTNNDYPIILDNTGFICDGWHRVVKAIAAGDDYIDAIRIKEMPDANKITNTDE